MPNVLKIFAYRSRPITRGMVAQNPTKHQCRPILLWAQLLLCSHVKHANRLFQLVLRHHLSHTIFNQFTFSFSCLFELSDKFIQISLVFLLVVAAVTEDGLGVGDDEPTGSGFQVVLHLQVLVQTPVIEVLLHVLNDYPNLPLPPLVNITLMHGYNSIQMDFREQTLILPNSHFILLWSLLFSLFIIAYFSCAVFQICFISDSSQPLNTTVATVAILILCLVDTLITINTKIVIHGELPLLRLQNAKNYFYSMLSVLDAILILILIVRIGLGANNEIKYALALSILDLFVALKFYNLRRYERSLKFYYLTDWSLLAFEFFKYLILLAFLCHIVGCIYFLIDALLIQAAWYPIQQHWLVSCSAMPNLYSAPVWEQYLYSFYFSIVTLSTVAYGDITPLNPTQTAFVICILAFLLAFYAYIFGRIYEVVNWFNRKSISTQQNKYRIANFLKKLKISKQLSDKIISQYQFREKQTTNINKDLFIYDIPSKLMESYQSTSYKFQKKIFVPNFISKLKIGEQNFNELLTQKFILPDQQFGPISTVSKNGFEDRTIYYVQKQVRRTLRTGTAKIAQNAEMNKWLGINAFLASYHDSNEKWTAQIPVQFITLGFNKFRHYLHHHFKSAQQQLISQCHSAIFNQGSVDQMNKCLLCWQSYHCSLFCSKHRHYVKNKLSTLERKDSKLTIIKKKINQKIGLRKIVSRFYKTHVKIIMNSNLIMPHCQIGIQTEAEREMPVKCKKQQIISKEEKVYEWKNYMKQFNISKYNNLTETKQIQQMRKTFIKINTYDKQINAK